MQENAPPDPADTPASEAAEPQTPAEPAPAAEKPVPAEPPAAEPPAETPAAETPPAEKQATAETPAAPEPAPEAPVAAAAEAAAAEAAAQGETQIPEAIGAAVAAAEAAAQLAPQGRAAGGYIWGTGRRKTSVARVRIRPGSGKILINKRSMEEYFRCDRDRLAVRSPLAAASRASKYDVWVNVNGGGTTGQAFAVRLGLARALAKADPAVTNALREQGLLTRDARMSERKKPGQPGARKRFQFSKR